MKFYRGLLGARSNLWEILTSFLPLKWKNQTCPGVFFWRKTQPFVFFWKTDSELIPWIGTQNLVMSCASLKNRTVSGVKILIHRGGCWSTLEFGFDGVIPLVKGCHVLPTLKLNIAPEKMQFWRENHVQSLLFRCYVSLRECSTCNMTHKIWNCLAPTLCRYVLVDSLVSSISYFQLS